MTSAPAGVVTMMMKVVDGVVLAVDETISAEEQPLSEYLHHNTEQQYTHTHAVTYIPMHTIH